MSARERIARRASKAGLNAPAKLLDGLEVYFELLRKWNRKVSLTSLPVEECGEEAIDRLLIEPIVASRYVPDASAAVIDIGSGGGSPAIPLKLAIPTIPMRMVESRRRKAAFLREAIRTLAIDDTVVEEVRFEELLDRPDLRESAAVVTLRAVKVEAKTLAELQYFLRPGGYAFLFGTSTPVGAGATSPQLVPVATHSLLEQWGSY